MNDKILTLAVFDFDGTIIRKDSLLEFIRFTKGNLRFYSSFLLFSPLLMAMKLKWLPNWKVKQLLFTYLFQGVNIKVFDDWGNDFIAVIDKMLYPKALDTLKRHRENGDKIIIISASIENWIKPWAVRNGVDLILATKIEINKTGALTGRFLTKNCYGQEKVNRLLEMFPNKDLYYLVAYGDSRGDRELIELADEGFYNKFK